MSASQGTATSTNSKAMLYSAVVIAIVIPSASIILWVRGGGSSVCQEEEV